MKHVYFNKSDKEETRWSCKSCGPNKCAIVMEAFEHDDFEVAVFFCSKHDGILVFENDEGDLELVPHDGEPRKKITKVKNKYRSHLLLNN